MYDNVWYKVLMYGLEFVGRYYSSYRGFGGDNNDPENLGRVKVIAPIINALDNKLGTWAYPKGQWGGKNYGIQMLPKKGDMIWVSFEMGDLGYPMWSPAGYGTDEKPEEFDDPNKYGFKTPAGNLIIIDDTEDVESILVKHKSGKEYIKLVEDKIILEGTNINLGVSGDEAGVMGDTLKSKLDEILDAITTHTHTSASPGTPSSPPLNAASFTTIKGTLSTILSELVKIDKL